MLPPVHNSCCCLSMPGRSLVAAFDLAQEGITAVQVMKDGYTGWFSSGRCAERETGVSCVLAHCSDTRHALHCELCVSRMRACQFTPPCTHTTGTLRSWSMWRRERRAAWQREGLLTDGWAASLAQLSQNFARGV
jgi:hypothetical protein